MHSNNGCSEGLKTSAGRTTRRKTEGSLFCQVLPAVMMCADHTTRNQNHEKACAKLHACSGAEKARGPSSVQASPSRRRYLHHPQNYPSMGIEISLPHYILQVVHAPYGLATSFDSKAPVVLVALDLSSIPFIALAYSRQAVCTTLTHDDDAFMSLCPTFSENLDHASSRVSQEIKHVTHEQTRRHRGRTLLRHTPPDREAPVISKKFQG